MITPTANCWAAFRSPRTSAQTWRSAGRTVRKDLYVTSGKTIFKISGGRLGLRSVPARVGAQSPAEVAHRYAHGVMDLGVRCDGE